MSTRTLTLLLAAGLLLTLATSCGPPPLEVTGESTVIDGTEQLRIVVQTRPNAIVQARPGQGKMLADDQGMAVVVVEVPEHLLGASSVEVEVEVRKESGATIAGTTIQVARTPRLVAHEVLPTLGCPDGGCTLAVEPGLKLRLSGSGTRWTVGGVPIPSGAETLPPRGVLAGHEVDAVLAAPAGTFGVPVTAQRGADTFEGELRLERRDLMEALALVLAEAPNGPIALPDGAGQALAWVPEQSLDPVTFYGPVAKLGDIGRVAVPGAEEPTGRAVDCGMYGNDQGDRQRKRLKLMKLTVDVYEVRTGQKLHSKTFAPTGRCPDAIKKGAIVTRILPGDEEIGAWLQTL